jgi:hypothetical protein
MKKAEVVFCFEIATKLKGSLKGGEVHMKNYFHIVIFYAFHLRRGGTRKKWLLCPKINDYEDCRF